jgi:hypothetical protein
MPWPTFPGPFRLPTGVTFRCYFQVLLTGGRRRCEESDRLACHRPFLDHHGAMRRRASTSLSTSPGGADRLARGAYGDDSFPVVLRADPAGNARAGHGGPELRLLPRRPVLRSEGGAVRRGDPRHGAGGRGPPRRRPDDRPRGRGRADGGADGAVRTHRGHRPAGTVRGARSSTRTRRRASPGTQTTSRSGCRGSSSGTAVARATSRRS